MVLCQVRPDCVSQLMPNSDPFVRRLQYCLVVQLVVLFDIMYRLKDLSAGWK